MATPWKSIAILQAIAPAGFVGACHTSSRQTRPSSILRANAVVISPLPLVARLSRPSRQFCNWWVSIVPSETSGFDHIEFWEHTVVSVYIDPKTATFIMQYTKDTVQLGMEDK